MEAARNFFSCFNPYLNVVETQETMANHPPYVFNPNQGLNIVQTQGTMANHPPPHVYQGFVQAQGTMANHLPHMVYDPYQGLRVVQTRGAMANHPQDMRRNMGTISDERNLVDIPVVPLPADHLLHAPVNNAPPKPKPRFRWSDELHDRFVQAVYELGGASNATPKTILMKMGVAGITIRHVKSHLQKYRTNLRDEQSGGSQKENGQQVVAEEEGEEGEEDEDLDENYDQLPSLQPGYDEEMERAFKNACYNCFDSVEAEEAVATVPPVPVAPYQTDGYRPQVPSTQPVQPQLHGFENDIYALPPMTPIAASSIEDYLNALGQSGELEMENLIPGGEPVQPQCGGIDEAIFSLPPITPSPTDRYLKAFSDSGNWAMENLLTMEIGQPWDFGSMGFDWDK